MATDAAAHRMLTTQIPGQRTDPPDIRPPAGHELLVGVEAVIAQLGQPGSSRRLADDLRTVLARTAATGDSCRVRAQADGVRRAADLLLRGDVDEARPVLIQVRAELADRRRR